MDGGLSTEAGAPPWTALRRQPPFDRLTPGEADAVLRQGPWTRLRAGEAIPEPSPGELLLLARGELEVRAAHRLLELREGPAVLLTREPLRLRARSEVVVAYVGADTIASRGNGSAHAALCDVYERELARVETWRAQELRKSDDFFVDDGAELVPGPYRFGPYRATALLMEGDPGRLRHELPPGLSPIPGLGGRHLIVLSEIEGCTSLHPDSDGRAYEYLEVAAFLPCIGPRLVPGMYLPRVYPDAYLPILLGREAFGFPKRLGRVLRRDDGFDLVASHRNVVRARWNSSPLEAGDHPRWLDELMRAVRAATRLGRPRLYLRKRILGVRGGPDAAPCLDQLIALPFSVTAFESLQPLGDARVEFPEPGWGIDARCVGAARFRLGFEFSDARVARTYPATPKR